MGHPIGNPVNAHVNVPDGKNAYMLAIFPGPQLVGKVLSSQR